jgi:integrase
MGYISSKKYQGVQTYKKSNGDIVYYIRYRDENDKMVRRKVGEKSKNIDAKYAYEMRNDIINKIRLGEENIPLKKKKRYLFSEDFEDFQHQKLSEGYKPATVAHMIGSARHCINYNIKHEKVRNYTNPIGSGKLTLTKEDNARVGFFNKDQIKKLLEVLKNKRSKLTYYLTILLVYTGGRFSEIASLTWYDIDFENKLIYFKSTKGGNARHIVMNDLIYETLQELHKNKSCNLVIPSSIKTQIDQMPRQWQDEVDKIIPNNKKALTKHRLTVHSLRHTHASWLAMGGLDILQIKEQLGHRTLEMTLRYAHLIPNTRHKKVFDILN